MIRKEDIRKSWGIHYDRLSHVIDRFGRIKMDKSIGPDDMEYIKENVMPEYHDFELVTITYCEYIIPIRLRHDQPRVLNQFDYDFLDSVATSVSSACVRNKVPDSYEDCDKIAKISYSVALRLLNFKENGIQGVIDNTKMNFTT